MFDTSLILALASFAIFFSNLVKLCNSMTTWDARYVESYERKKTDYRTHQHTYDYSNPVKLIHAEINIPHCLLMGGMGHFHVMTYCLSK